MITYLHCGLMPFKIKVYLDGKVVGSIRRHLDEYYYQPKGGTRGEYFPTIKAVKESIEG